MPGPQKTFEENHQTGRENAEADSRRRVPQTVTGTDEQDKGQIAEPSESDKRPDHRQPPYQNLV